MRYWIAEVRQVQEDGSSRFMEIAFSPDDENYFTFDGRYSFHLGNDVMDFHQDLGHYHNGEVVSTKLIVDSYDDVKGFILTQLNNKFSDYEDIYALKDDFIVFNEGLASLNVLTRGDDQNEY